MNSRADVLKHTRSTDVLGKLRILRDSLTGGLVERDLAVRLALLASLAGEHMLMLGPPGTAKSLIARRLHMAFADSTYFERLLTRFSVPEELFGPLSIRGLEQDRYERLTDAYLPKASIAFLDEIFKANSAILNALLTLLNEREFDNGAVRDKTPLVAVIGASNELPEDGELDALFDRFLLRLHVGPVTQTGFPSLLGLRGETAVEIPDELKLQDCELQMLQSVARAVEVPEDVVALLCDLRDWCTAEEILVSDRRWRKVVKLLQVSAATNGRCSVSIWDCWLLQHCLWDSPESREKVYEWYATRVGASATMDTSRLTTIVVSLEARLKSDKSSRSQTRDADGHPLFKDSAGKHVRDERGLKRAKRRSEPLFLAPADSFAGSSRHSSSSIQDRTNGGKGYTQDELDALYVRDPHYGAREFQHWSGREAYLADESNWLMKEQDLAAVLEPTRYIGFYVDARVKQMDAIRADVEEYRNRLLAHIASLEAEIREHLWVTADFIEPAADSLEQTRQEVETLLSRVGKVREGFANLPREEESSDECATPYAQPTVRSEGTATPKGGRG
ncbi:MAG: AAA domain-containing protein [Deltaproteobacteria bacterium]|nr:AAA domain-containing protein [Deltaproteobacteria bacterium]